MVDALPPCFVGAYLVTAGSLDAPVGVVHRDRHLWRILLFGIGGDQQPSEEFATREQAALRLLQLARPPQPPPVRRVRVSRRG